MIEEEIVTIPFEGYTIMVLLIGVLIGIIVGYILGGNT